MGNRSERMSTDPKAKEILERLSRKLRQALAAVGKITFNEQKPPADQEKKK